MSTERMEVEQTRGRWQHNKVKWNKIKQEFYLHFSHIVLSTDTRTLATKTFAFVLDEARAKIHTYRHFTSVALRTPIYAGQSHRHACVDKQTANETKWRVDCQTITTSCFAYQFCASSLFFSSSIAFTVSVSLTHVRLQRTSCIALCSSSFVF